MNEEVSQDNSKKSQKSYFWLVTSNDQHGPKPELLLQVMEEALPKNPRKKTVSMATARVNVIERSMTSAGSTVEAIAAADVGIIFWPDYYSRGGWGMQLLGPGEALGFASKLDALEYLLSRPKPQKDQKHMLVALSFTSQGGGDGEWEPMENHHTVPVELKGDFNADRWGHDYKALLAHQSEMVDVKEFEINYEAKGVSGHREQETQALAALMPLRNAVKVEEILNEGRGGQAAIEPVIASTDVDDLLAEGKWKTHFLLSFLMDDLSPLVFRSKWASQRDRPRADARGFVPLIQHPEHPSFPSGHAFEAWLAGLFLCEVVSGHKDKDKLQKSIRQAAACVGLNREIAGVHFASDTKGGQVLAEALFEEAKRGSNGERLQKLIKAAQAEWR